MRMVLHAIDNQCMAPAAEAATNFDFEAYMTDRAKKVNAALDAAVPLKYPEELTEAMR